MHNQSPGSILARHTCSVGVADRHLAEALAPRSHHRGLPSSQGWDFTTGWEPALGSSLAPELPTFHRRPPSGQQRGGSCVVSFGGFSLLLVSCLCCVCWLLKATALLWESLRKTPSTILMYSTLLLNTWWCTVEAFILKIHYAEGRLENEIQTKENSLTKYGIVGRKWEISIKQCQKKKVLILLKENACIITLKYIQRKGAKKY